MGLALENARWSYSGFNQFREKLGKEVGVNIREMEGFTESGKSWESIQDPIVYLLNHSDCDGIITGEQCALIAPRVRELVKDWPEHDYDKSEALVLADDMDLCAKLNKPLIFS